MTRRDYISHMRPAYLPAPPPACLPPSVPVLWPRGWAAAVTFTVRNMSFTSVTNRHLALAPWSDLLLVGHTLFSTL